MVGWKVFDWGCLSNWGNGGIFCWKFINKLRSIEFIVGDVEVELLEVFDIDLSELFCEVFVMLIELVDG